jgi:hypothetical protein
MGKPSDFDESLLVKILQDIANGKTVKAACEDNDGPDVSTLRRWTYDDTEGFAARFTRARELGIHAMIDECIEISDETSRDTVAGKDGEEVANHEWISRSRLRVDTRKWLASKIVPKIYGDKVQTELTGAEGGPLTVSWLPRPPKA